MQPPAEQLVGLGAQEPLAPVSGDARARAVLG